MMALHPDFLRQPIAHRGLHRPGLPENSMAAFRAAIANGYAIECDIQRAMDSTPMVFHDYDLTRMCEDEGYITDMSVEDLAKERLGGTDEPIPTLAGNSRTAGTTCSRRVMFIERVTSLTLPAASDRFDSKLLKRSWFSSPKSWLMRLVASSTLLKIVIP